MSYIPVLVVIVKLPGGTVRVIKECRIGVGNERLTTRVYKCDVYGRRRLHGKLRVTWRDGVREYVEKQSAIHRNVVCF